MLYILYIKPKGYYLKSNVISDIKIASRSLYTYKRFISHTYNIYSNVLNNISYIENNVWGYVYVIWIPKSIKYIIYISLNRNLFHI